ncbi:MAG: DUF1552 domain-containing protein [Verrucomicrobiota bacterium]
MSTDQPSTPLPRRAFLRNLGVSIALPMLSSMPSRLLAEATPLVKPVGVTPDGTPLRMAFVYHPNGVIPSTWYPETTGKLDVLPPTLEPLKELTNSVRVISGLNHEKAEANGDGAGDHARANATFLTGMQAKKTGGQDIRIGTSIDQIVARELDGITPLSSMELSCSGQRTTGSCDSGYSCAYQYNLSWRNPNTPNPPESNPRAAFERLFGDSDPNEKRRILERWARRQSVLDGVRDDARTLYRQVSAEDRDKLAAYLDAVRAVEQRVEAVSATPDPPEHVEAPRGIPGAYSEYLDVMYEMMAIAFETDMTRVTTFMLAHDGSNRTFPEIDVRSGHHQLSHHKNEADKIEQLKKIDRFYVDAYARFLKRMRDTKDVSGKSLLDSSIIVYGGGIRDGNKHDHGDLPVLLSGGGGGTIQGGDHFDAQGVPMCNLYVELAQRMGVNIDSFGDSSGRLGQA